ncbi:hypothetical protein MTP99_008057 [Tenebrio molitor]|nr:hypothetical protein MTP99_008057 [Tenebrio molitor]
MLKKFASIEISEDDDLPKAICLSDKPYKCEICQKTFRFASALPNHKRIHLEGRNEELISDLIMNFAYVEVFEDDELPKSICPICLKYLNDIYDFKDLIVKSDLHLRSQQVKTVDSDEDSENMNDLYNADTSLDEDNLKYHQPIVQIKCEGEYILKKDHSNVKIVINRLRVKVLK